MDHTLSKGLHSCVDTEMQPRRRARHPPDPERAIPDLTSPLFCTFPSRTVVDQVVSVELKGLDEYDRAWTAWRVGG